VRVDDRARASAVGGEAAGAGGGRLAGASAGDPAR